jgi:hypothetical protein
MMVCTVNIDHFGVHSSSGEAWLDDDNASTSAEAQSFKRACAHFGLGRYMELLNNDKPWTDLDERMQPFKRPTLPDWALPRALRAAALPNPLIAATHGTQPNAGSAAAGQTAPARPATQPFTRPSVVGFGPAVGVETELNKKFRLLKQVVGSELFTDIVEHVKTYFEQGRYTGNRNDKTLECFARAQTLLQKLRDLSELLGESRFGLVLDAYSVPALNAFTSIDQLSSVVGAIERLAA